MKVQIAIENAKKSEKIVSLFWDLSFFISGINIHAVGRDSLVHFSSSNFLVNILQPKGSKSIYMSYLCKLRHRKNVHQNFRDFLSQERQIRISFLSCFLTYSFTAVILSFSFGQSHFQLCLLRHRKQVLENLWKFISQERLIRILVRIVYCF